MLDLKNEQYDMHILRKHIYEVNLWDIITYQKINEEFAIKYILNPRYKLSESEKKIDIHDIMFHQPHLIKKKLFFYLKSIDWDEEDSVDYFDD
jgi:hypothetical protein